MARTDGAKFDWPGVMSTLGRGTCTDWPSVVILIVVEGARRQGSQAGVYPILLAVACR